MSGARQFSLGVTLVELMLALAVSTIIMLAGLRLYAHAAAMNRTAQSVQSLAENTQLGMTALRLDIERAGFLGLVPSAQSAGEGALQTTNVFVRNDCGEDWATRITEPVGGSNNGYTWSCPAYAQSPVPGADTLVVRFTEPEPADDLESGRTYLRTYADGSARAFVAPEEPQSTAERLFTTHILRARGYYVSTSSAGHGDEPDVPSLRVKHLTQRSGRAVIVDQEVQPGIEDLQVEFGTGPNRFVTAAELAPGDRVVAVRIWLLARSQYHENGLDPEIVPAYADRRAHTVADGYRRRLAAVTIAITDDRPL